MKRAIVVGGGISGLLAAIILKRTFDEVLIIESSDRCGGLLNSIQDEAENFYDTGTHIPNLTGIHDVDDILFGSEKHRKKSWHHKKYLNTGNYFNGAWNLETQTVSIGNLSTDIKSRIESEILATREIVSPKTLKQYFIQHLGKTATKNVFSPIFQKLYGRSVYLDDLVPEIGGGRFFLFGHQRLVAFDEETTTELKKDPHYDAKLAFHTSHEYQKHQESSSPQLSYLYPKSGRGIGVLIENLLNKTRELGVKILTGTTIKKITSQNNRISSVKFANCETEVSCDHVFWSVPPALGLAASGIKLAQQKIRMRSSNIFHFCFDTPLLNTQSDFLWSWDCNDPIFRITLYDNFRAPTKISNHQITVECLSDNAPCKDVTAKKLKKQLVKMELVSPEAQCLSSCEQNLKATFPIPNLEFRSASETNYKQLQSLFSNITISGRYSGKVWLQSDVLQDTYNQIMSVTAK